MTPQPSVYNPGDSYVATADLWTGGFSETRNPLIARVLRQAGFAEQALHAKCVVVDEERALVTSANFTEAAQMRNIEAGVLIADASLARALKAQFDTLVDRGALRRVPGL